MLPHSVNLFGRSQTRGKGAGMKGIFRSQAEHYVDPLHHSVVLFVLNFRVPLGLRVNAIAIASTLGAPCITCTTPCHVSHTLTHAWQRALCISFMTVLRFPARHHPCLSCVLVWHDYRA